MCPLDTPRSQMPLGRSVGLDHVSSRSWDIWGFFQNNFFSNYKIGACSRKLRKISIKKKIKIAHNPPLAWRETVSMWSFSFLLSTNSY